MVGLVIQLPMKHGYQRSKPTELDHLKLKEGLARHFEGNKIIFKPKKM